MIKQNHIITQLLRVAVFIIVLLVIPNYTLFCYAQNCDIAPGHYKPIGCICEDHFQCANDAFCHSIHLNCTAKLPVDEFCNNPTHSQRECQDHLFCGLSPIHIGRFRCMHRFESYTHCTNNLECASKLCNPRTNVCIPPHLVNCSSIPEGIHRPLGCLCDHDGHCNEDQFCNLVHYNCTSRLLEFQECDPRSTHQCLHNFHCYAHTQFPRTHNRFQCLSLFDMGARCDTHNHCKSGFCNHLHICSDAQLSAVINSEHAIEKLSKDLLIFSFIVVSLLLVLILIGFYAWYRTYKNASFTVIKSRIQNETTSSGTAPSSIQPNNKSVAIQMT